jgi:type I restriction enzyme S subunit
MSDAKPEGWTACRLRDIFRERKERGSPGLPIASVSIDSGLVLRSDLDRRVSSSLTHEEHALVRKGDITYNMMRMWQGACGLARSDCVVSPAYVVMTPSSEILPDFALEMLRSPDIIKLLRAYSQGIVDDRLRLYPDAFGQVPINLPPLNEQQRIVDILRSADEAAQVSSLVNESLAEIHRRAINSLCFRTEDEDWKRVEMGEILEDVRYGTSAKCESNALSGMPVLRIPNVLGGRINSVDLKFASLPEAEQNRLALRKGDILVVRTNGNPANVGRSALVGETAGPLFYASYLIRLRLNSSLAWPPFIDAAMKSFEVRKATLRAATTSAGNYNINSASLRKLKVPLPALHVQKRIADTLDAIGTAADSNIRAKAQFEAIRLRTASDLLSGRVRVSA